MKKLYKVTVNNYGWSSAKTLYFATKEEAQAAYEKYPAADQVQYAGNFSDSRAAELVRSEDDTWSDDVEPGMVTNQNGTKIYWNVAVEMMDDDIREELARELSPCTEQEFFAAYEKAHAEKYGADDWELSKTNPVY